MLIVLLLLLLLGVFFRFFIDFQKGSPEIIWANILEHILKIQENFERV